MFSIPSIATGLQIIGTDSEKARRGERREEREGET